MRKPDNKLVKVMMLGTLAFMMMCSFKVSATETLIIKCTKPKTEQQTDQQKGQPAQAIQVAYQDFACADDQIMEVLKIEVNQSADLAPGLRDYEKVVLERAFIRQMVERVLNS